MGGGEKINKSFPFRTLLVKFTNVNGSLMNFQCGYRLFLNCNKRAVVNHKSKLIFNELLPGFKLLGTVTNITPVSRILVNLDLAIVYS